jgi:carbon storage regulator
MLVLTRRVGQRIEIGPDIAVNVLRISEGQVRLGIEAPLDVHIVRDDAKQHDRPRRIET